MTVSGVAAATAVALLVPAMQATSSDEVAADRSNAPSARAADLRAEATLAGAPLGAASGRPNAPFPPDDDTQAMVLDGLKGGEYVAAQTGVIEEAPEPAQVAESEPEPEPTATAEPEPEPEPTATAEPEPEPEPESTQQETTASSSGGGHTSPDGQYTYEHSIDTWERLAQCESNGDWSINTGNGYYGGIQFSKSSWDSVGGSGYPHENSKWEQIHRGELLHDRQGWGAWPECSRKLGLR